MSIEEKGKWVILINFILFPIGLMIYIAMSFESQSHLVEYVNPVQGSCPENFHFRNDGFCYKANCTMTASDNDDDNKCERVSINCPVNKQWKPNNESDKTCYSTIFYVNPSEPRCPEAYYRSGDMCVSEQQQQTSKVPLECEEHKVLKDYKCFSVNETASCSSAETCVKQEL